MPPKKSPKANPANPEKSISNPPPPPTPTIDERSGLSIRVSPPPSPPSIPSPLSLYHTEDLISNLKSSDKQNIILLAGYPGSGKSSIVKEVIDKCGQHILISGDHAEGDVGDYEYFSHSNFDTFAVLLKKKILEWPNMSIIIDKPFLSVERGTHKPEILGWAYQMQLAFPYANIVISLLDIPKIDAFKLMTNRWKTKGYRGKIPKDLYDSYETFIRNYFYNGDFIDEIINAGYEYIPLPVDDRILTTILRQTGGKKSRKKLRRRVKKTRRRNKSQYKYK